MSAEQDGNGADAAADWADEHRFEVIIGVPVVRQAISSCAAHAQVPMSAEEFLARAAVVFPALGRAIRSGSAARGRARALKRGWRTGRSQETGIPAPIGRVIASVLCSMAYHGQAVHSVEQREGGCTPGVLQVDIDGGDDRTTTVHAKAEIPGQLYDWGKSRQTLAALFADILALPGSRTLGTGITTQGLGVPSPGTFPRSRSRTSR
ncbi:hypothetical protein [Streptomyces sp. NPDC002078]